MNRIAVWLSQYHPSTYLIFVGWMLIALVAHPSVASYLIVMLLGPWLFLVRDLARIEGFASSAGQATWLRFLSLAGAASIIALIAFIGLVAVKWIGI
jgi:hypothetical protein